MIMGTYRKRKIMLTKLLISAVALFITFVFEASLLAEFAAPANSLSSSFVQLVAAAEKNDEQSEGSKSHKNKIKKHKNGRKAKAKQEKVD